jgi:hypothetical protein
VSSGRLRGEEGASLVLALAFLGLLGVFVASVLSFGAVSFQNTVVTRSHEDRLYAADGGIEWGVQQLAGEGVCPAVTGAFEGGVGTFPTQLNGKSVTVECMTTAVDTTTETTGSTSPLIGNYSAIIGTGGIQFVNDLAKQAPTFLFKGDVYSQGAITIGGTHRAEIDGSLQLETQPCTPANVYPTGACTTAVPPNLPDPTPTVTIPSTAPPPQTVTLNGDSCTILYPGKYGSGGRSMPTFAGNGRYYLASGTYYFNDTGPLALKGEIFGGEPASTDTKRLTSTPCANDADAHNAQTSFTAVGKGVTFILGGDADFRTQSANPGTRVELFTRESPESGATPGVTIWARGDTQFTSGDAYNPRHGSGTGGAPIGSEHKLASVVLHGLTYVPGYVVSLNKEPINPAVNGTSMFLGGLVAEKLLINIDGNNGSEPLVASLAGGSTTVTVTKPRTTVLKATATGTEGTKVITAVVDRTTNPPTIRSWRQE